MVEEGAHVVVLVSGPNEPIRLSPAEENELLEAMEEIRRGEYVERAPSSDDHGSGRATTSPLPPIDLKLSQASPATTWRRDDVYRDKDIKAG